MKTVFILAGGKGARLKPFTMILPKPLLPLGDAPIIEVVLKQLAGFKFERVVISLGHMAHLFEATIGDGSQFGLVVEYVREDTPLGTAAPLRMLRPEDGDVLVMNGDLLTTLDFGAMLDFHRSQGACASLALHKRSVFIDYGVIDADADGTLTGYTEKPTLNYEVSMGVYVVSAEARALIPAEGPYDMPALMLAVHASGRKVSCYRSDVYWQDIGRFDDYQQASADFVADPARFLP